MLKKILLVLQFIFMFKDSVWKRITSPIRTVKVVKFVYDLIQVAENSSDEADNICDTLDFVVKFKRENPQEYREIFVILEDFLVDYEKNADEFRKKIREIKE